MYAVDICICFLCIMLYKCTVLTTLYHFLSQKEIVYLLLMRYVMLNVKEYGFIALFYCVVLVVPILCLVQLAPCQPVLSVF